MPAVAPDARSPGSSLAQGLRASGAASSEASQGPAQATPGQTSHLLPASEGPQFTSSIAQRRLQRRPMGLRLDTGAGAGASMPMASAGLGGNGPLPTAHGTWTMGGVNTPVVPRAAGWEDSAPSTPRADVRQGFLQSRPAPIIGASVNSSDGGSVAGTPSEASESLMSFQRCGGPLSSSMGGISQPFGGLSGSSRELSKRVSARNQRQHPLSPVAGLHYASSADIAVKLNAAPGTKQGLVIDTRKSAEYLTSRIAGAINMSVSTTLAKRKTFTVERLLKMAPVTDEQKRLVEDWKSAPWVVLYGDGSLEDVASEDTLLVLLARKFTADAPESCSVYVLQDGFRGFPQSYQSLCEFGGSEHIVAAAAATIPSLSLPSTTSPMPPLATPYISSSNPQPAAGNRGSFPMLSRPSIVGPKPTVDADHPMLRTMRQTSGGTYDPRERVAMRLPHDFDHHESQRLESLPEYLRRAADPKSGPGLLNELFGRIDASESRRMSSMIGSNGMVTKFNSYTISAALGRGSMNRYTSIVPFDNSRVRLRSMRSHQVESKSKGQLLLDDMDGASSDMELSESDKNDYVNASYVAYFDGPLYIATQGPLPETVNDFWRMVWEDHVRVIVMLTKEVENARPKCHHYWPARVGETATYGNLCVEFQVEAQHPDDSGVVSRRFRLTRPSASQSSMCITHLQYTGWADHEIPENPLGVLRLQQLARKAQEEGEEEAVTENVGRIPMVVHCSAGCGRTGTFCAIDTILAIDKRLRNEGSSKSTMSRSTAVDVDGDVRMDDGEDARGNMQVPPAGRSYDKHGMYTSLIPQALRSKSSGLDRDEGGVVGDSGNGSPTSDQGDDGPRNRRSLSQWIEEPPSENRADLVYMVVSRFRELRVLMVQTMKQFVFCHEALAWVALGAGPRPIEQIIDRRLVAEWNRANHPKLDEAEYMDITYLMRGRQEMVQAMASSEIGSSNRGGSNSNSASISYSGSASRASIDIISTDSTGDDGPPLVKRSNTVGPARRGFFTSLFKPVETAGSPSSSGDSKGSPSSEPLSRSASLAKGRAGSVEKRKGLISGSVSRPSRKLPSLSLASQAPIAEEDSPSATDEGSSVDSAALAHPYMPMPSYPLPAPPPLMTCGIKSPEEEDYFGIASTTVESPANLVGTSHGDTDTSDILDMYVEPEPAVAAPGHYWRRRGMLGHLDPGGDPASRSPTEYANSSALASPSAQ
ncbi:phosphotyrosine-specific ptp2-like protein [Coemansia sp. RSA 552]|nr:phosphotyrosine-specific ptp2-like protein [Coemansia sp. RSA 552]